MARSLGRISEEERTAMEHPAPEDRIDFVDLETQLKKLNMQESGGEEDGGKEEGGGDGGLDENPLG